jgi:sRNA-binding protein
MTREKLRLPSCDREPEKKEVHKASNSLPPKIAKVNKHDLNVEAVILLLQEKWPHCFSIHERNRKPLKVGIFADVMEALDGAVTHGELAKAIGCYVGNREYRITGRFKEIAMFGEVKEHR